MTDPTPGTIALSATGTLSNTATVAAPAGVTDPTPGNDSATDSDTVLPANGYFTLTPCRAVDTRGGSALAANAEQTFALSGVCGVPVTATAVQVNLTVVGPTAAGEVRAYSADLTGSTVPTVVGFSAGQTRASNVVVSLNAAGQIKVSNASAGTTDLILDVSGYFE